MIRDSAWWCLVDLWKTILIAAAAAAAVVYMNNRYRLPVIGLTDDELAKMAEKRSAAADAAAAAQGE